MMAGVLWLLPLGIHADDREAWEYYRKGEAAFVENDYGEALRWYRQALEIRPVDGSIVVAEEVKVHFVSRGRAVVEEHVRTPLYESYAPNARITQIERAKLEARRREAPPNLELRWLTLQDPTHDNVLDGGEVATLVVALKNYGRSPALDVNLQARCRQCDGLEFPASQALGAIAPEEERILRIDIKVARDVVGRDNRIQLIASEVSGFDSNTLDVLLQSRPHRPGRLELSDIRVDDLTGDGRVEPAETVRLTVRVRNMGEGLSEGASVEFSAGENVYLVPGIDKSISVGQLYPGEHADLEFAFLTNRRIKDGGTIPLTLEVTDVESGVRSTETLELQAYVPEHRTTRVSVAPKAEAMMAAADALSVDVDEYVPRGRHRNEHAVAVVIGNRNYQARGVPNVRYALNDAQMVRKYLVTSLGYQENNIIYLEDATAARFHETFGSTQKYTGKLYSFVRAGVSDVFIYYSGHGAPDIQDQSAYFVPVDVDPNYIGTSGYSLDTFYRNLAELPARSVTVVLDTCFSGNSDGGFLLRNVSPATIKVQPYRPAGADFTVFASASRDQVSTWYHEKRHGLFTYFFLKGLGGAADVDADSDVTVNELGDYVSRNVPYVARRLNGQEQTPFVVAQDDYVVVAYDRRQETQVASPDRSLDPPNGVEP